MRPVALIALPVLALAALIPGCRSQSQGSTPAARPDAPARATGEFRQRFEVRRSDLGPTGAGAFFDLRPGTVRMYREGDESLTVTVLDQTAEIDGVITRIVEEREESGGRPKEVSRNYFAIDRATGDVYYFGEDVDVYKDGRISGHPGAWKSGQGGSRFGLFVPARPRVGDRFYQEIAPGIAMDRAEVVSVDETVATPAGTFAHCLHIRETTPLESDVSHKWFAPGVGLVKDDDLVLVSHSPVTRP